MQNCQIFSRIYCQDFSVLFFIGNEFRPIFFAIFGLDSVSSRLKNKDLIQNEIFGGVACNGKSIGEVRDKNEL